MQGNYLNLGCGSRFIEGWINIDFVSTSPAVMAYDLTKGVPLPDNHCDIVYHSHVLEHFSRKDGAIFIGECFRVLKPGGVLRVAVPDLEGIVKEYLATLHAVQENAGELQQANYQWALLELIDQMVRTESGGEMFEYWKRPTIVNEEKLADRLGFEFLQWRNQYQSSTAQNQPAPPSLSAFGVLKQTLKYTLQMAKFSGSQSVQIPFEQSGEKHKWMYDVYALSALLKQSGFSEVKKQDAFTSFIDNWSTYSSLDVHNGLPRKPDSLFMEAIKPLQD